MLQPQILNVIQENGLKLEKRALVMGNDAITFGKFPCTYGIPISLKMSLINMYAKHRKISDISTQRAVNSSYFLTARFEQTNMNRAKNISCQLPLFLPMQPRLTYNTRPNTMHLSSSTVKFWLV